MKTAQEAAKAACQAKYETAALSTSQKNEALCRRLPIFAKTRQPSSKPIRKMLKTPETIICLNR